MLPSQLSLAVGRFGECSRHLCEVSETKPVGVELCFGWPFTECNYPLNFR